MLYGAAVGAGFSAFESTGYAFYTFVECSAKDALARSAGVIIVRTVLQFFAGHTIWTAMCCGALWKVKGDQEFKQSMLLDWKFLRIALIAVGSHMLNNSYLFIFKDSPALSFWGRHLIIGLIDWLVIIVLLKTGINQVAEKKKRLCSVSSKKSSEENNSCCPKIL